MSDIRGCGRGLGGLCPQVRQHALPLVERHQAHQLRRVRGHHVVAGDDPNYPRGFDVNYLNPMLFYRPVEYRIGSPDNALLGFAFNVKVGKRALLYAQLMLDEFLLDQVRAGTAGMPTSRPSNSASMPTRRSVSKGSMLRAEFNYVRPFMYTHSDTRQNYAHMGQPLAHPYGSNVQEALAQGDYGERTGGCCRPLHQHGVDGHRRPRYSYGNNIFRNENSRPTRDNKRRTISVIAWAIDDQVHPVPRRARARAGLVDPAFGHAAGGGLPFRHLIPSRKWGRALSRTTSASWGWSCHFRDRHPEQEVRYVLQ